MNEFKHDDHCLARRPETGDGRWRDEGWRSNTEDQRRKTGDGRREMLLTDEVLSSKLNDMVLSIRLVVFA